MRLLLDQLGARGVVDGFLGVLLLVGPQCGACEGAVAHARCFGTFRRTNGGGHTRAAQQR